MRRTSYHTSHMGPEVYTVIGRRGVPHLYADVLKLTVMNEVMFVPGEGKKLLIDHCKMIESSRPGDFRLENYAQQGVKHQARVSIAVTLREVSGVLLAWHYM